MPPFRSEIENKAVKKTLTIPHWLDKMGKANNVNYSQVLQDALKKHLGVTENKISKRDEFSSSLFLKK